MISMNKLLIIFKIILFVFFFSGKAFGTSGLNNSSVGLKGCMLNAYTGLAEDSTAVFWNPSGLVFHEKDTYLAEMSVSTSFSDFYYEANQHKDRSDEVFILPGFFVSKTFDKWAFGVGSYIPYAGGGTEYNNFQKTGHTLESFAAFAAVTTSVAYKLDSNLSVGFSISGFMGQMENNFHNGFVMIEAEYNGYAGHQEAISLMYKPSDKWNLGIVRRFSWKAKIDGEQKVDGTKIDSEIQFNMPDYYRIGIGYKPNQSLAFVFDVLYMLWSDLDEFEFITKDGVTRQKSYYKDCFLFGLGMEYALTEKVEISLGWRFSERGTKRNGMRPDYNDVSFVSSAFGIGYDISDSTEIVVSYTYTFTLEEHHNSQKYGYDLNTFHLGARFIF